MRRGSLAALLVTAIPLLAAGTPRAPLPVWAPEPQAAGDLDQLSARLEEAQAELIGGLETLVDWCKQERLFARRKELCEWILSVDPNSEPAHLGLLHKKNKQGVWEPPKKTSPVKDYTKSKLVEYERRRAELGSTYADVVTALAAELPETPGGMPFLPLVLGLERGLELAPDHRGLRAMRGEARAADAPDAPWVLLESLAGAARRPELKQLVAAAYAAVPAPEAVEPDTHEAATGVSWKVSIATPLVRVLSTGPADEAEAMARAAHATLTSFGAIFDTDTKLASHFGIYILASEADRAAFVSGWYSWGPEHVESTQAFVGMGLPKSQSTARWDPDPKTRLDGAIRHTVGELLRAEFKLDENDTWAWEGLGLYLTHALVGTRRTFYGQRGSADKAAQQLLAKLVSVDDSDWLAEFVAEFGSGKVPLLDTLLAANGEPLGVYGMLESYALAAYLLEGHPQQTADLLGAVGAPRGAAIPAFGKVLGRTPSETQARLLRWLAERR